MRVTENGTTLELLRRSKVVLLGIDEVTGDQVVDGHLDGENCIGLNCSAVRWEDELGRWHSALGRNLTDGGRVARTLNLLLAISELLADTEVDEVVGGGERSDLA